MNKVPREGKNDREGMNGDKVYGTKAEDWRMKRRGEISGPKVIERNCEGHHDDI